MARAEPVPVSRVHNEQRTFVRGQRRRLAPQRKSGAHQGIVGISDQRLGSANGVVWLAQGDECGSRQAGENGRSPEPDLAEKEQQDGRRQSGARNHCRNEPTSPPVEACRFDAGQLLVQHAAQHPISCAASRQMQLKGWTGAPPAVGATGFRSGFARSSPQRRSRLPRRRRPAKALRAQSDRRRDGSRTEAG